MAREDSVFSADSSKLKSIGMRLRQLSDGICDGTGLPVTCLGTVRLVLPFSPFSVCLLQCALVPHGNEKSPTTEALQLMGPHTSRGLSTSDRIQPNLPYKMSSKIWWSVGKSHRSTTKYPQKGAKIGQKGCVKITADCGQ